MKTISTLRMAVAAVLALSAASANALTATDNMLVTAEVVANCTISVTSLDFGDYDPIVVNLSTHANSDATVTTTCTIGSSPMLTLGNGSNFNVNRRLVNGGSNFLNYGLYSDVARATAWTSVAATTPTGLPVDNTIFARLPAGQNKPVGAYTDTVVVTVTF